MVFVEPPTEPVMWKLAHPIMLPLSSTIGNGERSPRCSASASYKVACDPALSGVSFHERSASAESPPASMMPATVAESALQLSQYIVQLNLSASIGMSWLPGSGS